MTEREKCIDIRLFLTENVYWKLVAIAAEDQLTAEDWLDEHLPAVVKNLVTEKN